MFEAAFDANIEVGDPLAEKEDSVAATEAAAKLKVGEGFCVANEEKGFAAKGLVCAVPNADAGSAEVLKEDDATLEPKANVEFVESVGADVDENGEWVNELAVVELGGVDVEGDGPARAPN